MHCGRSDVAERQGHIASELALDIEIPLHPITAARIKFNMGGSERARCEQLENLVREAGDRRIGQSARLIEGSAPRNPADKDIRQGDDIEHPEPSSHGGLAILE